jgi:PAS domain-containing protein
MARQILKVLELRRISVREHEQRLRAEALAQEGGRGRLTWQVSPDLLAALNSRGCFQTSNPAWKNMLGWTEPEVASMSIFNLLHGDDVERTRDGFNLTQDSQIVSVQGWKLPLDILVQGARGGYGLLQRPGYHGGDGKAQASLLNETAAFG